MRANRLSGRPLLATRADQRLYVTRDADAEMLRAVTLRLNVALVAERGAGATSALHALEYRLLADRGPAAVAHTVGERAEASATLADGGAAGSHALGEAAATPPPPYPLFVNAADLDAAGVLAAVGARATEQWAPAAEPPPGTIAGLAAALEGAPPVVVLLDNADAATARRLFGTLRDEVWELDVRWVLTVPAADPGAYLAPPADAFFEAVLPLGRMTPAQAADLLERRLGEAVTVPASLDATPREILDDARSGGVAALGNATARDAAADAKAAALGRPEAMLLAELRALGGAAASDERLLKRMGWTAARASQVFRSLLAAGLVSYSDERDGGPGRPRRIYRPAGVEDD